MSPLLDLAAAPQGPPELEVAWRPTADARIYRGRRITGVVIHYTAGGEEGAINWLVRRNNVSAHYVIGRSGAVTQLCRVQREAFHAGMHWGRFNPNRWTVGLELVATHHDGYRYTEAQMDVTSRLVAWLFNHDGVTIDDGRASATLSLPLPYLPDNDPHGYRGVDYWKTIFQHKPGFIIGHSAVNPHKPDPGRHFDFHELLHGIINRLEAR